MQERGDIASKQLSLVDRRLYLVNDLSNRKKGSALLCVYSSVFGRGIITDGSRFCNRSVGLLTL